jgi:predicted DCC family thiol-disulfide oxidoreductase YuxK
VQWVLRRDRAGEFRFAALQSTVGAALLAEHGLDPEHLETVVLVTPTGAYLRSDAALAVVARLPGLWRYLRFLRFVPRWLRDALYDLVARHRYAWFGRYDTCPAPAAADRERFLDWQKSDSQTT